jgi:hypothetical protein
MTLIEVVSDRCQKEFPNSGTMARPSKRGIAMRAYLFGRAANPVIF